MLYSLLLMEDFRHAGVWKLLLSVNIAFSTKIPSGIGSLVSFSGCWSLVRARRTAKRDAQILSPYAHGMSRGVRSTGLPCHPSQWRSGKRVWFLSLIPGANIKRSRVRPSPGMKSLLLVDVICFWVSPFFSFIRRIRRKWALLLAWSTRTSIANTLLSNSRYKKDTRCTFASCLCSRQREVFETRQRGLAMCEWITILLAQLSSAVNWARRDLKRTESIFSTNTGERE